MAAEAENLFGKLRVQHILILARFVRMRLQSEPVAPVEALPEILRKGSNPPASG
jgi:hypothetical protein